MNNNAQSALKLGHARAAAMIAPARAGLPVAEYAATVVKKAVVGTGAADKAQVGFMIAPPAAHRRQDRRRRRRRPGRRHRPRPRPHAAPRACGERGMIGRLRGMVAEVGEEDALIDVVGVGYVVRCGVAHPVAPAGDRRRGPAARREPVRRADRASRLYGFLDPRRAPRLRAAAGHPGRRAQGGAGGARRAAARPSWPPPWPASDKAAVGPRPGRGAQAGPAHRHRAEGQADRRRPGRRLPRRGRRRAAARRRPSRLPARRSPP